MTSLGSHPTTQFFDRTVVIPAFNESHRLPYVLRALRDVLDHDTSEVIVVDDGSTDDTAAVAEHESQWVHHRVISFPQNQGKGAAVRAGVAAARSRSLFFLDADNATDVSALAPMEAELDYAHAVYGSRNAPGAVVVGSPPLRGYMGRGYAHLTRVLLHTSVSDSQCGCKAFRTPVAKVAFALSSLNGFAFDAEVLYSLHRMGLRVIEFPVKWTHRSGSKVSMFDSIPMFRDTLRVRAAPIPAPLPYLSVPLEAADELAEAVRRTDPVGPRHQRAVALLPFASASEIEAIYERVAPRFGDSVHIGAWHARSRSGLPMLFAEIGRVVEVNERGRWAQ